MKRFKGISPLVATIMLVAFTLILAGIISAFVVNFTETQQMQIKSCVDAKALLQRASYDQSTQQLRLSIYNYGKVDLKFQALLTYPTSTAIYTNTTAQESGTAQVNANSIGEWTLNNVSSNLVTVTIKSAKCDRPCAECPGVMDSLMYNDIVGLR